MSQWKYFSIREAYRLDNDLMFKLDRTREYYGHPVIITSGFRTFEKNKAIGGVVNSAHLTGLAVDVRKPEDPFLEKKLIWALGRSGFERIFIYGQHIHADVDVTKPSPAFGKRQY